MYRCRLVAGRRLRILEKNARFQSNGPPHRPKAKPRIASDWGGIRISNEPLAQQLTAHHIQTERSSGGAPNPEPIAPTLPLDQQPPPNAPILLDLPPPITLNAVGMNKPLLNKSKAFQKTVANFEQFFERKQPEPAQAEKKKPVPVVSTGNVGPQGYVRRSALKDGPPQPNRRNAPPSVTRAMGRQGVSRAPARREPQMDMEEDFEEEEEEEEEMSPEEFAAHIDELVSSATEEQSIALMQDAMEALDLTDQEKEALTDDDKREVVKEWVAHNFIEELANKQEEMDAEEEEEGLKEIDEYEDEDEQDSEKWLASLDPEDQELVSESLDAAATQYMRFYRREETLEPEYLEADVDFSLPPYGPPDGIQDGLHPYRPLFLAKTRPPHDFVRDDYSRSLPIKPRTLRKTVAALGPLRHAQAVVGHTASIDAYKKERLAKLVADVTSSS